MQQRYNLIFKSQRHVYTVNLQTTDQKEKLLFIEIL